MTVRLVQYYEYTSQFETCVCLHNSFVFSTDGGLLIAEILSDMFRSSADYKILRTLLPYSSVKPFEDKNFKEIRYQRPIVCQEHNLAVHPNNKNWCIIYMGNYSNFVVLEKNDDKWIEKYSDIPQKWFLIVSKKKSSSVENFDILKTENRTFFYCRQKEKQLQIKNFVFTHILKHKKETEVYGTICCHVNNLLTFWSTTSEKNTFLNEYEYHTSTIKHIKWFQMLKDLSWLFVFLTNGQIYVHEICDYPHVANTFILWSDEDFACVKNICIECISNNQCLIFMTKMAFVLVILYSLAEKHVISIKKEMIPKTMFIPGITYVKEKNLLIIVTDVGKFVCMKLSTTERDVTYSFQTIDNDFHEHMQNFTCTSVVFSQNKCTCVLALECNMARYSKNDGHKKNKLLFCSIPENLVELEKKILSVNKNAYDKVIDCIETLRINKMNDSNEVYELDRKLLDICSIQHLKLDYWKIAFKSKKNEHDENILQELQMLLHIRHLTCHLSKKNVDKAEQYFARVMLSFYINKLSEEYKIMKMNASRLINLLKNIKHTHICNTCERILLSFTDFRMFICELEHKELRCPITLGPLVMPCLVCSMCFTMANKESINESCVWCYGKYIPNNLLL